MQIKYIINLILLVLYISLLYIAFNSIKREYYNTGYIDGYNQSQYDTKQIIVRDTVYVKLKTTKIDTVKIISFANIVADTTTKQTKYAELDTTIKNYADINIKYYFDSNKFELKYIPLFKPIKLIPNYPKLKQVPFPEYKYKNKKNNYKNYIIAFIAGALSYAIIK